MRQLGSLQTRIRVEIRSRPSCARAGELGRGGLVLWIDNQYAAFRPDGEVAFGSLACNDLGWLDIMDIQIEV